jgi:chemotaxis protein methyltransferase CheR
MIAPSAAHSRRFDAIAAEFAFGNDDFDRVRALIGRRAGILLAPGRQAMVYSRLSRRLRTLGCRSFGAYLQWLEQARGESAAREWQEFVNCLTTNRTAFFREGHHFAQLEAELLRRRGAPLRLWCNAASTGEEPYSMAMTVIEALGEPAAATILATDIDTRVLAVAKRGIYGAAAQGLSTERLRRHFLRGRGANAGLIRVKPGVQQLLTFQPHNLVDGGHRPPGGPFDIVFCRNVMIYFDLTTQRRVLERLHGAMRPDGLLFAGHSEHFASSRDLFRLRGKSVYERV